MHVTSGFASDLWHKNSSVGLTQAHPISVLVSVYNRQLCKLIVGSRDRPLIAVWKTYRGGITSQ